MAETFKIKPLEWGVYWEEDRSTFIAHTVCGNYTVTQFKSNGKWSDWSLRRLTLTPMFVTSAKEGKQLAEQHWEAYLKQALVQVDAP